MHCAGEYFERNCDDILVCIKGNCYVVREICDILIIRLHFVKVSMKWFIRVEMISLQQVNLYPLLSLYRCIFIYFYKQGNQPCVFGWYHNMCVHFLDRPAYIVNTVSKWVSIISMTTNKHVYEPSIKTQINFTLRVNPRWS